MAWATYLRTIRVDTPSSCATSLSDISQATAMTNALAAFTGMLRSMPSISSNAWITMT
ncbi:hypothetical protein D3C77_810810 [compost metagenome]